MVNVITYIVARASNQPDYSDEDKVAQQCQDEMDVSLFI